MNRAISSSQTERKKLRINWFRSKWDAVWLQRSFHQTAKRKRYNHGMIFSYFSETGSGWSSLESISISFNKFLIFYLLFFIQSKIEKLTIRERASCNCSAPYLDRRANIVLEQSSYRFYLARISACTVTTNVPIPMPWRSFLCAANRPTDFRFVIECIAAIPVRYCLKCTANPFCL